MSLFHSTFERQKAHNLSIKFNQPDWNDSVGNLHVLNGIDLRHLLNLMLFD